VHQAQKTGDSLDKIGFVSIQNTKKEGEDVDVLDTSKWKTYRNEEYGFELKYPEGWTSGEVNESEVVDTVINKYFYVKSRGNNSWVWMSFGVKKVDEKNVMPRAYRTGVPAGDFSKRRGIKIDGSFAEKRYLIYRESPENSQIKLIWFCGVNSDLRDCDNFSIDSKRVAFIEVTGENLNSDQWDQADKILDKIISSISFHTIN
jgi:hypothetical protein